MSSAKDSGLLPAAEAAIDQLARARRDHQPELAVCETGTVHTVSPGVARVSGLPGVGYEELVRFESGDFGIAFNIDEHDLGVVLLCDSAKIANNTEVRRTGRVIDIPVGDELLGRVIDPLGNPLDDGPPLAAGSRLPIERPAPAIIDRAPVTKPLQTVSRPSTPWFRWDAGSAN